MRHVISWLALCLISGTSCAKAAEYCVVVQAVTYGDASWKAVADTLVAKHDGELLTYVSDPGEVLESLRQQHPRYTCFVATREQAGRDFVATVHQLTRKLDSDPYTDTLWGILTGYDAANAQAIAAYETPLTIRKVASGTEIALEMCEQGLWYDELQKNKLVSKEKDGDARQQQGPDDTTEALVKTLNEFQPDLFVTSGHATERNWQIGFRYRNGYFRSQNGQMFGEDTARKRIDIDSQNAKVYLPIGNCLMGHIDGPDAMALAWMNDVGVKQMMGYTVPTWFGYGGWGVLDYFVEQPGRYSLTEAFFANHQALLHSIETGEGNQQGMTFDRDVVAFYGDPAWEARMADADRAYDQSLTVKDGIYTFRVTPNRGRRSFEPVNTNGAQRGWRPIVHWLPQRVKDVRVIKGSDFSPVITDDFLLLPNPRECDPSVTYEVVFTASPVD
jgi:zinc protease